MENVNTETTAAETENPETSAFTVDNIERRFYSPETLADSNEYVSNVIESADENELPVFWNINPEEPEIPDGYGLAVTPVQQKQGGGKGLKTIAVLIGAVPTYDHVFADDAGQKFIRQTVTELLISKMISAARPRGDETIGKTPFKLPLSIADFIERRGSGENLKSYTEISGDFVSALKKQGMKFINATMLRECLASVEFASQQFPQVSQENWEAVIGAMRNMAVSKSLDPAIFDHWKETRDETHMNEVSDENILGALAGLVETPTEKAEVEEVDEGTTETDAE